MERLHVGDQVVVIRGNDKGKRGKVAQAHRRTASSSRA